MCEEQGVYLVNGSPAEELLERLGRVLGEAGVRELLERIEGLRQGTRFGDVHLVIAEGRVTHIKTTVSVKVG